MEVINAQSHDNFRNIFTARLQMFRHFISADNLQVFYSVVYSIERRLVNTL
jgi:hypothetical protein